jgi:hypothetical protein
MKTIVYSLFSLLGKHWLRIGVILCLLFIVNKKQINLNVQFGKPTAPLQRSVEPRNAEPIDLRLKSEQREVFTDASPKVEPGWFDQLGIFSAKTEAALLTRSLEKVDDQTIKAFLTRFAPVAQTEMEKFKIPASVILANALLHSTAGTAASFTDANNAFGLSCTPDWIGPTRETNGRCLRRYENAWTSFRDHSLYLTTGKYAGMTALGARDFRSWITEMERLGYNDTDPLAEQLFPIIDEWQLFRFD